MKHGSDTKKEEKNKNVRERKKEKKRKENEIIKHTGLQIFKVLFRLGSIPALFKRPPLQITWFLQEGLDVAGMKAFFILCCIMLSVCVADNKRGGQYTHLFS